MMKIKTKIRIRIITAVVALLAIWVGMSFFGYNTPNQQTIIRRIDGKISRVESETGPYILIPLFESGIKVYTGEQLDDIPASGVITADKKSLEADCYLIWQVTDPLKYYQNLSNESAAKGRLDAASYNAMKTVISSKTQQDVISGKDGTLSQDILNNVKLGDYGISITDFQMKMLDLPDANKQAVYERMISERRVIEAQYVAEGDKVYNTRVAEADSDSRKIISDAEVEAANIAAEAERKYYQILADAYSSSEHRIAFYQYMVALDSLKISLSNGGTVTLDNSSPLYQILIDQYNTDGVEVQEIQ